MAARGFKGVKFKENDDGPETGEVGMDRIMRYAREAGWLNDLGDPDFSRMVRHMCTQEAHRIERAKRRAAREAATEETPGVTDPLAASA